MRYVPRTKKDRLALVEAQIQDKIGRGYTLETYKGLRILTKDEDRHFNLMIYKDAAAHPIAHYYYRTIEQRTESIANYKSNYNKRAEWKEESKKDKTKSTAANAACAIREELKKVFPGIRFSVTSETFSMGNAVRVGWNDGPTSDEVQDVTKKYQYYKNEDREENIPRAKYVTDSRSISKETRAVIEASAEELYQANPERFEHYTTSGCHGSGNFAYRVFQHTSLPAGAKVLGIKYQDREGQHAAVPENSYTVSYEAPEQPQTKSAEPQIEKVEVQPGTVQIIEYGRGIAVIGETKPIKDLLKSLGGRFNFRLTCGAGWVFRRADLERVTEAIKKQDGKQGLRDEIQKTVEFFADTDRKLIGAVSESTQEIARVQNVKLPEDEVKHYDTIEDLENAANSGEVISLLNMHELVNKKEPVNAWGQTSSQARKGAQQRRMDKAAKSHGAARRGGHNTATYY